MDLVVRAPRMPREGETLIGSEFRTIPGGKGANQAVACARLGAQTQMIGRLGNDAFGAELLEGLTADGIDTTRVGRTSEAASGTALIIVDDAGANSIVVVPGTNACVAAEDIEGADSLFQRADALVCQLEVPLDAVDAALTSACEHGKLSILDAGPPAQVPAEILAKATVVSPNETEAEALTGITITDDNSAQKAAQALLDMGCEMVALKLGNKGSLVGDADGLTRIEAIPVEAVDTTAAGDAFTAALAVKMAAGVPLRDAAEYASCAAALSVTRMGAQPAMPKTAEVDEFIGEKK